MQDRIGDLEAFLQGRLRRPVRVRFGRSRTTPVCAESGPDGIVLRLHRFFRDLPRPVAESLAAWLGSGRRARRACRTLDAFLDARLAELEPAPPRRRVLEPRGRIFDLIELARPLYAREFRLDFERAPRPGLTWGRRARSRARRSLQLGSYSSETNLVTIHPVLDCATVPAWFVRAVLFHEILHAALFDAQPRAGARARHHGPAFRERERAYPDTPRALRWQKRHLGRLIRAARRPPPPPAPPPFRQATLFDV